MMELKTQCADDRFTYTAEVRSEVAKRSLLALSELSGSIKLGIEKCQMAWCLTHLLCSKLVAHRVFPFKPTLYRST